MIGSILLGFALGLQHATDSDHIVAVTALASENGSARRSALTGAFWGLGHLLTLFLVGSALILLRVRMSPRLDWALELLVALTLIWLGVHTVRKCFAGRYHFHAHEHGGRAHAHLHFHPEAEPGHVHDAHAWKNVPHGLGHGSTAVLVGMAHGLAGSGGLALLVLASIPSRLLGLVYLIVFGVGALTGMVVFSALLGLPFSQAAKRVMWVKVMRIAAGSASGLLGVVLAYRALLPGAFPF